MLVMASSPCYCCCFSDQNDGDAAAAMDVVAFKKILWLVTSPPPAFC